jgi:gliding motility-associated-like protein
MDTLQNPVYSYSDTGSYVVELIVANSFGCTDTAFKTVTVIPEYALYAPNAFTPNNHDGLNDLFMPKGVGIDPNNFEMLIFDRWGNMIFKTTDINKGWDGHANKGSAVAQEDTYVWKIVTKDTKGNDHQYLGHVTIVK